MYCCNRQQFFYKTRSDWHVHQSSSLLQRALIVLCRGQYRIVALEKRGRLCTESNINMDNPSVLQHLHELEYISLLSNMIRWFMYDYVLSYMLQRLTIGYLTELCRCSSVCHNGLYSLKLIVFTAFQIPNLAKCYNLNSFLYSHTQNTHSHVLFLRPLF